MGVSLTADSDAFTGVFSARDQFTFRQLHVITGGGSESLAIAEPLSAADARANERAHRIRAALPQGSVRRPLRAGGLQPFEPKLEVLGTGRPEDQVSRDRE